MRTVRAVNHHDLGLALLLQSIARSLDTFGVEVGASSSTTENDEAVFVTSGSCDGSQALLGHTHEVMLRPRSANSIDRDSQTSISTVLEANGERETRCELAVQLRLSCSCTDSAKGDEVCKKLWRDCVEHLRSNWHALGCEVDVELARDTKTLVDLVALVNVWVVDQTLPANSCSWLLEVGAHDDADVVLELVGERLEALAVLNGHLGVVDGARSNHDHETVILLCDDLRSFFATFDDGLLGVCGDGEFV
jgi:hypothetical protein